MYKIEIKSFLQARVFFSFLHFTFQFAKMLKMVFRKKKPDRHVCLDIRWYKDLLRNACVIVVECVVTRPETEKKPDYMILLQPPQREKSEIICEIDQRNKRREKKNP